MEAIKALTPLGSQSSHAWVAYMDVFGFSAALVETGPDKIQSILIDAHRSARKICVKRKQTYLSFSDSIFVIEKCNPEKGFAGPENIINSISEIMTVFYRANLPIRGSVAFGPVTESKGILVGQPVVNAVRMEGRIRVPLLFIPASEIYGTNKKTLLAEGLWDLVDLDVALEGIRRGILIFPDDPVDFLRYSSKMYEKAAIYGPPNVAMAWAQACRLTEQHLIREKNK